MEDNPNGKRALSADEAIHLAVRMIDPIPTNCVESALPQDMPATVGLAMFIGGGPGCLPGQINRAAVGFSAGQKISPKISGWAIKWAPIAVFGLICAVTMRAGFDALRGMAANLATVFVGLPPILGFYLLLVF
jgi:Na+/H+-dicarboxylate symporter